MHQNRSLIFNLVKRWWRKSSELTTNLIKQAVNKLAGWLVQKITSSFRSLASSLVLLRFWISLVTSGESSNSLKSSSVRSSSGFFRISVIYEENKTRALVSIKATRQICSSFSCKSSQLPSQWVQAFENFHLAILCCTKTQLTHLCLHFIMTIKNWCNHLSSHQCWISRG